MENLENMSLYQILSETTEILGRLLPTPMVFESMDPPFVRSELFNVQLLRKIEYAYDAMTHFAAGYTRSKPEQEEQAHVNQAMESPEAS
ncbi:hypothetical protein EYR38_002412 [Pleurotus pulmonarius]|nr:hypothetical protein EYR38_002412 [Pleurotus pulmonarius]